MSQKFSGRNIGEIRVFYPNFLDVCRLQVASGQRIRKRIQFFDSNSFKFSFFSFRVRRQTSGCHLVKNCINPYVWIWNMQYYRFKWNMSCKDCSEPGARSEEDNAKYWNSRYRYVFILLACAVTVMLKMDNGKIEWKMRRTFIRTLSIRRSRNAYMNCMHTYVIIMARPQRQYDDGAGASAKIPEIKLHLNIYNGNLPWPFRNRIRNIYSNVSCSPSTLYGVRMKCFSMAHGSLFIAFLTLSPSTPPVCVTVP